MKIQFLYYWIVILFLATSCSNTRYLQDGELLYVGAKVKVEGKTISKSDKKALQKQLKELIRPKPNKKIIGLRPKLYFYNLAGEPKRDKGFRYWLRTKVGEPPVTFSQVDLDYNKKILQNYSENKGYFNASTTADSTRRGKKARAQYVVKPETRYTIKNVVFPADTTAIYGAIAASKDKSILVPGSGYDLDKIKLERERIDASLKEKGYYYFNADYLKIQVDSTVGKKQVDLIVKVKNETPDNAKIVYRIRDIIVYPNYSINRKKALKDKDTITKHNDLSIIDPKKTFDPRIFDRTLYFKKNDLYNRTNHNLSLNRLVNLGTFKFVKNQFKVADSTNNFLDAYYYLTPLTKKSIRVEILAKTNSANYSGTELNVNWSNRNTFKGAELLSISGYGGIEVQVSGQNNGFNVYRVGSEVNMIWPRLISPFKLEPSSGFIPKTKATLGYEYQFRSKLYTLKTLKASYGYLWKENLRKEHQLNVSEITFVSPNDVSDLYKQQISENPSLQKIIDKQLIIGSTYLYTYTNTMQTHKKQTIYFKGGLDFAGNALGLATGANVKKGDTINVFKVPFSQYLKSEFELRHYLKITKNTQLASRVIAGAGFSYGNSSELPFVKQFFIGGTNSIRAFRARSIGPGTYNGDIETNVFLPDQSGDVKFEFNTELRTKLVSVINGAVFLDSGNIWLLNKNIDKPGSQFSSKFLNELAVGTGVGLRFDFSFLILRTDLAFPLRKPYLPEGDRWVLDKVSFGDGGWRKENLVFNLAIGYPF